MFNFSGTLLLEDSSIPVVLQNSEGVIFWNGLHYFNVDGKNFSHVLCLKYWSVRPSVGKYSSNFLQCVPMKSGPLYTVSQKKTGPLLFLL